MLAAVSAARSSAAGICNAAVSESGPPDRARSTTRSPESSPKRGSFPPSTVKYAKPHAIPLENSTGSAGRLPERYLNAVDVAYSPVRPQLLGPRIGRERGTSCPALAPGAALQAFEDVGQSLVAFVRPRGRDRPRRRQASGESEGPMRAPVG